MRRIASWVVMAFMAGAMVHAVHAGTEEDSVALAKKAARFIGEHGKEKGIAELMNPRGTLKKGGAVVTVIDFAGVCLAGAAAPNLVGRSQYDFRDGDGKYYIREAIRIVKTRGGGWIEWASEDSGTGRIVSLNAWVQRVEGMDVFVMAPVPIQKRWYFVTLNW